MMMMVVWLIHVDTGVYDWMIIYVSVVSGFRIRRDSFSRSARTWLGGASITVL